MNESIHRVDGSLLKCLLTKEITHFFLFNLTQFLRAQAECGCILYYNVSQIADTLVTNNGLVPILNLYKLGQSSTVHICDFWPSKFP